MSLSESFIKQLMLLLIPMSLGSFIFIGVIEDYKNDASLKVDLLEKYYKPTRELMSSCYEKQSNLVLKYTYPAAGLKLLSNEINVMLEDQDLRRDWHYTVFVKNLLSSHLDESKNLKKLESEVKQCKREVFNSLEILSMATGTYSEFSELATLSHKKSNEVYKSRYNEVKKIEHDSNVKDIQGFFREQFKVDIDSKEGMEKYNSDMDLMMPVIKEYATIMTQTEKELFEIESKFYLSVRELVATEISGQFKEGFFSWLI